MAMPPMKFSFSDSSTTTQTPENNGQSVTPWQFNAGWNQVKNFSNKSSGSAQSANATAAPTNTSGASLGAGFPIMPILLAVGAFLILKK